MLITDPLFYLVAILVVLLCGVSKTGVVRWDVGGGSRPRHLPGSGGGDLLPVLCTIDLFRLRAFPGVWDRRNMPFLLTGLLVGIAFGTVTFDLVKEGVRRTATEAVLVGRRGSEPRTPWLGEGARRRPAKFDRVLRMRLVGANAAPQVMGREELPGKVNYLVGRDPQTWRTHIPTYAKVEYREVYPGVNLVYYGTQRQVEYDLGAALLGRSKRGGMQGHLTRRRWRPLSGTTLSSA